MYDYDLEKLQNLSHDERCYQHLIASLALFKSEVLKIKISGNRVNAITDKGVYHYKVNGLEKDHFLELIQNEFNVVTELEITKARVSW